MFLNMDRVKRIWYLSPMRAAKIQASLRIRAVSPEPPLLAHTSSESRGTFRQKGRDSSSGRASASCAVGQDGCRIDAWPRHTKDVIKMVPVAILLGAQHYKASTGFSSLTNHASLNIA